MSKPYFISRPSGLSCRFLVPADLRMQVGSRFIVRALHTHNLDQARLLAAILAIALSKLYIRIRNGEILDVKKMVRCSTKYWHSGKLTLRDGTVFEDLTITNDDDNARFKDFVASLPKNLAYMSDSSAPLTECIKDFVDERDKGELSQKNLADYKFALNRILLGICGDKPIHTVTIDDINRVMKALLGWPSNATKNPKLTEISAEAMPEQARLLGLPVIAARTREKYLDRLRAFFTWAKKSGRWTKENPFEGRRAMTKDKRGKQQKKPFDNADLQSLFDPKLRAHHCVEPHKFWCPLIALYSGARLNEIAQLYVDDIVQAGGVWVFQIDDSRSDQSLKNAASQRVVPVHKHLLELGFLEFLGDVKKFGFQRVFPNLPYSELNGYGDAVGDWFNGRYMRPARGSKAPRAAITDPKKTFHSFRYVVINRLYGLTDKKTLVAEVTGHERGNDVLTNTYITPTEAQERAETLNRMEFPFLTHPPYVAGQFDGFFRRLKRVKTESAKG